MELGPFPCHRGAWRFSKYLVLPIFLRSPYTLAPHFGPILAKDTFPKEADCPESPLSCGSDGNKSMLRAMFELPGALYKEQPSD